MKYTYDAVVIGGGIAGLTTALKISENCTVGVVSKVHVTRSHSVAAQGGIAASLGALKNQLSIPQITELMTSIGVDMEDFAVTEEITTDGINDIMVDTAVTDTDVKEVLGEIDAEIQVEMGVALPSAGSDEKIEELEKELNRLKSDE